MLNVYRKYNRKYEGPIKHDCLYSKKYILMQEEDCKQNESKES